MKNTLTLSRSLKQNPFAAFLFAGMLINSFALYGSLPQPGVSQQTPIPQGFPPQNFMSYPFNQFQNPYKFPGSIPNSRMSVNPGIQQYQVGPQGMMPVSQYSGYPSPGIINPGLKIEEDFSKGPNGWEGPVTNINYNGKIIPILGPFAGTAGQIKKLKTFNLQGSDKFEISVVWWALRSWDSETLSFHINNNPNPIGPFTINYATPYTHPKCSVINGVKVDNSPWLSKQLTCKFQGTITNGRLMIEGLDVTGLDPTKTANASIFELGYKLTLDQGVEDEAFGLESFKINGTGAPSIPPSPGVNNPMLLPGSGAEADPASQGINIVLYQMIPAQSGQGLPSQGKPIPQVPGQPQFPGQQFPGPGFPQQLNGSGVPSSGVPTVTLMAPENYNFFGIPPEINDTTTGTTTEEAIKPGASKCSICKTANLNPKDKEFCDTSCVSLERKIVIEMDRENDLLRKNNKNLKDDIEKMRIRLGNPPERTSSSRRAPRRE